MSDEEKEYTPEEFWCEATRIVPGSQMSQLYHDLTLMWMDAVDIRGKAEKNGVVGIKRVASHIERLALHWKKLSHSTCPKNGECNSEAPTQKPCNDDVYIQAIEAIQLINNARPHDWLGIAIESIIESALYEHKGE